jgi:hypothetical protein
MGFSLDHINELFNITYSSFSPWGFISEVIGNSHLHSQNALLFRLPKAHSLQGLESLSYSIFLFGVALIEVNIGLLMAYNEALEALPSIWCWPLKALYGSGFDALLQIPAIYYAAYMHPKIIPLLFLTSFMLLFTLWHFYFLLLALKCLFIDCNIFSFSYRCLKAFFSLILIPFALNLYMLSILLLRRAIKDRSPFYWKVSIDAWFKARTSFWTLFHVHVWMFENAVDPIAGFMRQSRYHWAYPRWMYFAGISGRKDGLKSKIYMLNLWSKFKLSHTATLELKEKKWWFFLASWGLIYNLRYYYYFMLFYVAGKFARLVYFFVVFSIKFIFFKGLKYLLEFSFIYSALEVFLWYYIQTRMLIRRLLPSSFYALLLKAHVFLKSYIATRILLDLHYFVYKFILLFSPNNYGFVNSEHLFEQPLDAGFNALRRFFWFQCKHNAHSGYWALAYPFIIFLCFYYAIGLLLKRSSSWGYRKIYLFFNCSTPLNTILANNYFFYNYFLIKGRSFISGFRVHLPYLLHYYFVIRLVLMEANLLGFNLLKQNAGLAAKMFMLFMALLAFLYAIAKLLRVFFYIAKAPSLPLALGLVCKFLAAITKALALFFLNNLLFYYMLLLAFLILFFYYDRGKAWRAASLLLKALIWFVSFFFFYAFEAIFQALRFFFWINKKLKLWAFLILILIWSFDTGFFFELFLSPLLDLLLGAQWLFELAFNRIALFFIPEGAPDWSPKLWEIITRDIQDFIMTSYEEGLLYDSRIEAYNTSVYWNVQWGRVVYLWEDFLYQPWRWFIALLFVFVLDSPIAFSDVLELDVNEYPDFHKIFSDVCYFAYYKFCNVILVPLAFFRCAHPEGSFIIHFIMLISTIFDKLHFELEWFIFADIPYSLNLFRGGLGYEFLKFWDSARAFVEPLLSKVFGLLFHIAPFALEAVFLKALDPLIMDIVPGAFAALASFWFYLCDCFNLVWFSAAYGYNLWMFFYAKSLKFLYLNDLFSHSFFREPEAVLLGYQDGKMLTDTVMARFNSSSLMYGDKDHILEDAPGLILDGWGGVVPWRPKRRHRPRWNRGFYAYNYNYASFYGLWFIEGADANVEVIGRWTASIKGSELLRFNGFINILRFCLHLDSSQYNLFPFPLLYRSLLIYLYVCFMLLILAIYLTFRVILGHGQEELGFVVKSSRFHAWTCLRDPSFKGRFEWLGDFDLLSTLHVEGSFFDTLLSDKAQAAKKSEFKEQVFFYSFYRYYKSILGMLAKPFKRPINSSSGISRNAYNILKGHKIRLAKKLKKYNKFYLLKPLGYVWSRPFDPRLFLFEKAYKDFILLSEEKHDLFIKFYKYYGNKFDFVVKDLRFQSVMGVDYVHKVSFKSSEKHYNFFERLVWGTYYDRLPIKSFVKEDVDMINGYMSKIFNYFYKIDKFILNGQGPFLLLHKDPGIDTLAYNEDKKVTFQAIEDPYDLNCDFDLLLIMLPLLFLLSWYMLMYTIQPSPWELESDDFAFLYLLIISNLEHFDLLHEFSRFVYFIATESYGYIWSTADADYEDEPLRAYADAFIDNQHLWAEYLNLPDYWSRELFNYTLVFGKQGALEYSFRAILDFMHNCFFFFSFYSVASPLLLAYCALKCFFFGLLILYFFIGKLFSFKIKLKRHNVYIEHSIFSFDFLLNLTRVKGENINNYQAKRGDLIQNSLKNLK